MKWLSKILGNTSADTKLQLLSDQPASEDRIRTHKPIAETLRSIITSNTAKPFVIGLFGSWGSGKSSILKMLESVSEGQFQLVVVDAWRKDKDNFLRQFIKKLARQLLKEKDAEEVIKQIDFRTSHSE